MADKIRIEVEDATKQGLDSVVSTVDSAAAKIAGKEIVADVTADTSLLDKKLAEATSQPREFIVNVKPVGDATPKSGDHQATSTINVVVDDAAAKAKLAEDTQPKTVPIKLNVDASVDAATALNPKQIAAAAKEAEQSIDELRSRSEMLMAAFRELRENGLGNFGAGGIERLKQVGAELSQAQIKALSFADAMRALAEESGTSGQPLAGFSDAVEREVRAGTTAVELFESKLKESEQEQRQQATKTANIIDEVRDQQGQAAMKAAEESARAFLQEEEAAAKAEQKFEQTSAALREIGESAQKSANESQRLWREADEAQKYAENLRRVADQLEKTGDASQETKARIAELRAEANKVGSASAALEREALAHENASRAAIQQGNSLAILATTEGVAADQAEKLAADNLRLSKSFDAAALARHRAELNNVGTALKDAQRGGAGAAQAMLQLGYAVDDLQYGMRGIVNNIPMLVQSLGGGAGVAGTLAIVGVIANQVANHWDELSDAAKRSGGVAQAAAEWWKILTSDARDYATLGLGGVQQAVDAVDQKVAESTSAFGQWGTKADGSAGVVKKAIYQIIDPMGLLLDANKKLSEEEVYAADKNLKAKAAKAEALKNQKNQEAEAAQAAAQIHANEIKALAQVQQQLAALKKEQDEAISFELLPEGRAAATVERQKRIGTEIAALVARERELQKAQKQRGEESVRLTEENANRTADQSAELAKQAKLTKELHDIETKRQQAASGIDTPDDERLRLASESRREAALDRVKAKTEETKRLAEQAASNAAASESQRASAREAHNAAVMAQIDAEADARKSKAEDLAVFQAQQSAKMASLDQEQIAVRQDALNAARIAEQQAIANHQAALADGGDQEDVRHKKAKADRDKATNDRLKAEADLAKQIMDNETRRRDAGQKNQDAATKQRIADEVAVGKAREKAMIDADLREQAIEDAKRAKLQQGLQAAPQVKQVAERIDDKIDDRRVIQQAIRDRQNAAERDLRAKGMEEGRAVREGDVAKVRADAGRQFIKDNREGKADAELAEIRKRFFDDLVDGARGLTKAQRGALKALAGEAANKIIEDAGLKNAANEIAKAKPEDKAAAKRNRTRDEVEDDKRDELNQRREKRGLEPLPNPRDKQPLPPQKAVEPAPPIRTPSEIAQALGREPDEDERVKKFREKNENDQRIAQPTGATGGRPLNNQEAPEVLDKKIADKEKIIGDAIAEATANGWREINRRTLTATWEKANGDIAWFRDYVKQGLESRRKVGQPEDAQPDGERGPQQILVDENRKRLDEANRERDRAESAARKAGLNPQQVTQFGQEAWGKSERASWDRLEKLRKELETKFVPDVMPMPVAEKPLRQGPLFIDEQDQPPQKREKPRFFSDPESPSGRDDSRQSRETDNTSQQSRLPDSSEQQIATEAKKIVTQTSRGLQEQSRTYQEILEAFRSLVDLQAEVAKQHTQLHDVVAQTISHVNGLQSQLVAQNDAIATRAMRGGSV